MQGIGLAFQINTTVGLSVAIAVLALICFHVGRAATTVLVAVIVGFAALEFFQTVRRVGFRPSIPVGVLASVAIVPIAYARGEFAYPFVLALTVVFSLLWFMFRAGPGRPVVNVAVTIGGFAYVGGLAGFAGLLLGYSNGIGLVLGIPLDENFSFVSQTSYVRRDATVTNYAYDAFSTLAGVSWRF